MFIFKTMPFQHQLEAFNRHKCKDYVAFNADMGVGKSKMAIDILSYKYVKHGMNKVLIIAPNGIHAQWINEQFKEHCSVPFEGHVYSSKKTNKVLRARDSFIFRSFKEKKMFVLAINIESFARGTGLDIASQFFGGRNDKCAVVIDEASIIKTPDIKTVKNVKRLRDMYPKAFRCTLTGTPAAKGPVNMWSIYDFLRKGYMGCTYIAFRFRHTVVLNKTIRRNGRLMTVKPDITVKDYETIKAVINAAGELSPYKVEMLKEKFGLSTANFWQIANSKEFVKYKNVDQLIDFVKDDTFMVCKKDCLDLPPKVYEVKTFPLNKHQKQLINSLQKYAIAMYQGETLTLEVKALLGLRVLQICGGFFAHHTDLEGEFDIKPVEGKNAKLEYIKHDLEEVGEQQAIVWAVYTAEVELLAKELSKEYSVGTLYGAVTDDKRVETVEKFKRGEIQHLVANPEVGGYGYNFQNAGVQYWYSRNYRTETRIQAEDRSYRIGTVKSPVIKDLVYDIDLEKTVLNTLKDEQALNSLFITDNLKKLFKKG